MITIAASATLAADASVASQLTCTIFGMELHDTTKAETYKVLYQGQIAATVATIYTATANGPSFIRSITIVNNDTGVRTFQLFSGGTAAANAITPNFNILPGGCAVYEDAYGWQFFNSSGVLLQGSGIFNNGLNDFLGIQGHYAESIPRLLCPEVNSTIPTASGTLFMQSIFIPSGTLCSYVSWSSATTAAGTPTNNIIGLYDSSRNLLAQTANQTTAAWAANTLKTLAFTTPYTTSYSGLYYIGFMMTATTIITSKGGTAKTGGQLAGQAPILHGISTTGLTTSLPNPAAAITGGLVSAYCSIS